MEREKNVNVWAVGVPKVNTFKLDRVVFIINHSILCTRRLEVTK